MASEVVLEVVFPVTEFLSLQAGLKQRHPAMRSLDVALKMQEFQRQVETDVCLCPAERLKVGSSSQVEVPKPGGLENNDLPLGDGKENLPGVSINQC